MLIYITHKKLVLVLFYKMLSLFVNIEWTLRKAEI
jgi:hypothetical protein